MVRMLYRAAMAGVWLVWWGSGGVWAQPAAAENDHRRLNLLVDAGFGQEAPLLAVSASFTEETVADAAVSIASAGAAEDEALAKMQTGIAQAKLAGHNAWMLTSSALVLFMTVPGLAMFYSGLVRRKNVLGIIMQCLFLMGVMTVVWALWGYSLAFGGEGADNPWVGNGQFLWMQNVERIWNDSTGQAETPMEGEIPRLTHMLFQGMFFVITPALICGAFAERMKFSAMVLLLVLWGTLVYCPLCHWVWDKGLLGFVPTADLANSKALFGGALDFAGGTVVHISSGVSALMCALVLGPRLGRGTDDMRPHNLTYTALGAGMLWVGWFGFNGGSALMSDEIAASAFAATHFSAAAGAVCWAVIEWLHRGKPSVLGTASGAVAGLVGVTPAAGHVGAMSALLIGVATGLGCYLACTAVKSRFRYDDSLDAFGVHGVGGTVGAILTGIFATRACWDIDAGQPLGLIEGETRILIGQLAAVAATWVFSAVATFVLLKVVDALVGLRIAPDGEMRGLDLAEHGEEGYIFN